MKKYDVIVVGGGHAGMEAGYAAARLKGSVLLLTLDPDTIGKLSCNPAVGGVSKGHLVREVDALGGLIGRIADRCALSYRTLNKSKGKAVWATRAQVDRFLYPKVSRGLLAALKNIQVLRAKAKKILVRNKKVYGVETDSGDRIVSKAVVICAGTFLKSTIHLGMESFSGGRWGEESSGGLFSSIKELGFRTRHFKTGTCARIDKRTVDFSKMAEQLPDYDSEPFSFSTPSVPQNQLSCYITYTSKKTHQLIFKNLKHSPLYAGKIKAKGVRYCPSLEDKVVKFPDRERHQVFIEPEGKSSLEVYPNGISTSLPLSVQNDFIHTIEGLGRAKIIRPGYGIEHGVIDPCQLFPTLEAKSIKGLFFAGQVNGTTGYEEAAAQGLIAGVNAGLRVQEKKPFILSRSQAFIGVLLDDLTSKGTDEPYRMFTSRCEFRLSLRESNAEIRLTPLAYKLKLVDRGQLERALEKKKLIEREVEKLRSTHVFFNGGEKSLFDILKRPQVAYRDIAKYLKEKSRRDNFRKEVEIEVKYEGFLKREERWLKELASLDKIKISKIDFSQIPSLSKEVREKLMSLRPATLGEALRLSGITPAAITTIHSFIKRRRPQIKAADDRG